MARQSNIHNHHVRPASVRDFDRLVGAAHNPDHLVPASINQCSISAESKYSSSTKNTRWVAVDRHQHPILGRSQKNAVERAAQTLRELRVAEVWNRTSSSLTGRATPTEPSSKSLSNTRKTKPQGRGFVVSAGRSALYYYRTLHRSRRHCAPGSGSWPR
jgi:hypothetical protein